MSHKFKEAKNAASAAPKQSALALKRSQVQKFIINEMISPGAVKYKRYERPINKIIDDGIVTYDMQPEKRIAKEIILHAEALPFLFSLDGCPQRLFYYILLFELNYNTGIFYWNDSVISRFTDFCAILHLYYKNSVIRQAIKYLSAKHIVLNITRGMYKMNPIIVGGNSEYQKTKLIKDYSLDLIKKGDDTDKIYPTLYTT